MGSYTEYSNEIRLLISEIGYDKEIIKPQISFILLTDNKSENKLDRCLMSIITQTYRDFEVIILDNDSETFTYSILDIYSNDKRIKVVKVSNADGDFSVETALKYITTDTVVVVKDNSDLPNNYLLNAIANNKLMKLPAINYNRIFNSIKTSDKNNYTQPMTEPVDLVYLWVNSNDEEWKNKKNSLLHKKNEYAKDSINDCRFEDNDELKYSLRSVEKNASWVNKIFIITDNQVPNWLNIDNNKIKIIDHKDIIPSEYLPLFNSCAIETRIPFIEELSENFIYANDDMFIWNPIEKEQFFNNGKVVFRAGNKIQNREYKHIYGFTINNAYKLMKEKFGVDIPYFPHHGIDAYKKSLFIECFETFKDGFVETLKHPFREFSDLQRIIVQYYMIYKNQGIIKRLKNNLFEKPDTFCCELRESKLKKIVKLKAKLLCINDSRKTKDSDREFFKKILKQKFSNKSQFEI